MSWCPCPFNNEVFRPDVGQILTSVDTTLSLLPRLTYEILRGARKRGGVVDLEANYHPLFGKLQENYLKYGSFPVCVTAH